ncbi:hypothetical protein RYX36_025071 [Vicia faba]
MAFEEGETYKKVFGPVFVYLNTDSTQNHMSTLWSDAKQQVTIICMVGSPDSSAIINIMLQSPSPQLMVEEPSLPSVEATSHLRNIAINTELNKDLEI